MISPLLAILLCVGVAAGAVEAPLSPGLQEQGAPQPPPEAVGLLEQLDDPIYERREQAERALVSMAIAEPGLRSWIEGAARGHQSPEVRARLSSVLARLEEHRMLGATLVSLEVRNAHPRELIDELGRIAQVRFEYWPQDPWESGAVAAGTLSLRIERQPFWEALRLVSQATGLVPVEHQMVTSGGMMLSPHGEQFVGYPTHHHGAFAVQLRRLQRSQNARMELGLEPDGRIGGNVNTDSSMMLELRLLVEPKIQLTGQAIQVVLEEASDDQGRSLLYEPDPRRGGRMGWSSANSRWSVQCSVPLDARAAGQSVSITTLRGQIEGEIATEMARLDVKLADLVDLSKLRADEVVSLSKRYSVGQQDIELTSLRRSDEQMVVEMTVVPHGGAEGPAAWGRIQTVMNALRLEDAAGRQWANGGSSQQNWDGRTAQISRSFQRPGGGNVGPPVRLVLEVPSKVTTVTIPFEFTDIPLPSWE